ncbi:agamous-like MADS-box protein AGL62 [Gossypium raimondii]|uniref:MADS-box domain-containing protein n=1 Tax=Gossypium raimondii TaxID=29730 RepID=A0A0D2UDR9_GOSRA|nr:agamous-like MADS-box protein AGL62 [Gossypium raimondii]KJB66201.1 hypothetical protein B456_010G132400 [Gossypium raimondii]
MTGSSRFQNDAQEFIRKSLCEIKIIENTDDRLIPFSKRCTTIYTKISMFSTLCGGEILFIIFSAAGKPYSFSYPSVESVAKSFSNSSQYLEETTDAPVETYRKERMNLLVQDFNDVQAQLDVIKEKQKEISLVQQSHGTEIRHWWKGPIDQLNLKELYEQDERFTEFNNLIPITRDKKIAAISSMQASMDKDIPSTSPSRYGPNL